jgi:LacI family transcriptional regulator
MVSLKDIAAACGVSTATVSKALRDQKDISKETKERIRQTADRMGYFPNAAARALKTNESKNLGVLYEEEAGQGLTHEYFSGVLQGFKSQAEELGYDITFISTHRGAEGMSYLEHCRYRNFAGVVIVCAEYSDPEVVELLNSGFPIVTIDCVYQNCTAVSSNNVQGMNQLLDYVIAMGHRRIAYIHGQMSSSVSRERVAVFYRAMEAYNIPVREEYVIESHFLEPEETGEFTKRLLELPEPPTCILYPDDLALIGGLNVIRSRGLRIPEDISLAGYDGVRFSQFMYPKLTTIQQDTDRIGGEAASRLVGIIKKPKTSLVERVVVEGILLRGESVGRVSY